MADCGASGSALDRAASVLSSAVGTAPNRIGDGAASAAAAAAAAAAGRAAASLAGNLGTTPMMPMTPPVRLALNYSSSPYNSIVDGGGRVGSSLHEANTMTMDAAWNTASAATMKKMTTMTKTTMAPRHASFCPPEATAAAAAIPPPHAPYRHHHHHHPAAAAMMEQRHRMGAMQMQTMHMQMQMQMQMQAMQMQRMSMMQAEMNTRQNRARAQEAASRQLERQKQISRGRVAVGQRSAEVEAEVETTGIDTAAEKSTDRTEPKGQRLGSTSNGLDSLNDGDNNDREEEEEEEADANLGHEGFAPPASIEELARAWADAEAEYEHEMELARSDEARLLSEYEAVDAATDMAAATTTSAARTRGLAHEEESMRPYEFSAKSYRYRQEEDNVVTDVNKNKTDMDLFSEGMYQFDNGNILDAIVTFESLLRHVDPDHADAWRMLGRCYAENDDDRNAIACLERAVERDPYSPESLLALGVCYVNELDHNRALRCLKNWITHNPDYATMEENMFSNDGEAEKEKEEGEKEEETSALEEVKSLLRRAVQHSRAGQESSSSSEALEALGVVCNVSREYNDAVDALRSATATRPDDYQLWNRLGATLANAGRSDEALPLYQKALGLKPKFARAWLNLAISHSNLRNYDEAARCYLQAISLCPNANHIWGYLRIALTCEERWDLLPFAAARNLDAFEEHFDFVRY